MNGISYSLAQERAMKTIAELFGDLRYGVGTLRRSPLFAIVTILTFAVGIGATAAMFSLVKAVLLSPLPYREPNQLLIVHQTIPELRETYPIVGSNARSILAWQRSCRSSCNGVAAVGLGSAILTGTGAAPERLQAARVSTEFFEVIGVPPVLGRTLGAGDKSVVVLSFALWKRRFAGEPNVIGQVVKLDGESFEIVGVLPESFVIRFKDWSQDAIRYLRLPHSP